MSTFIDFPTFEQVFLKAGREDRFPTGLRTLYSLLLDYGAQALECHEFTEAEVATICGDFTEMTLASALARTGLKMNDLEEHTIVRVIEPLGPQARVVILTRFFLLDANGVKSHPLDQQEVMTQG